ncbi:MAG: TIGR02221 family CRISPR-associated protein [Methylovulum sp.]|uniref:TIGR02221 family CRISPR-associated protein n=1 Tax=Methylovulum sp. TaxID=1916980 RepID=UPI002634DBB3|nr:TIGR02221 family CRISPR-associated protein [Methylovulum sp.]MDD2725647.1 TIGR02221 family CRISPR-associated protein [Methylovulum sp.]MDD5125565.1 TIGR02221 family CRISPR-associated protein [Methylovulum sp.]
MAHILISFLGKSSKQENGQYRQADYCFADDSRETARFFSFALNKHIKPEKLVILGTSGSMWDVLCEQLSTDGHEQWVNLSEAVETNSVSQAQLDDFSHPVGQELQVDCQLKRIPYGDNLAEQIEILQIMASAIQAGDTISLDLTHGLRHLPMLGLLSAMYLQTARAAIINGIYYGALDRTKEGLTPVMQLNGLLNIAEWLHALDGFNKTGNLAPFSELLQQDGMAPETAKCLEDAAFFENTLNIPNARAPLKKFTAATANGLTGIGALFEDSLRERIAWHKEDKLYQRQQSNAYFYLQQGDYLRAAALGYEALITLAMQQDKTVPKLDPQDFRDREKVAAMIDKNADYKQLRNIRNSLAHGSRSDIVETQRALASKANLHAELTRIFNTLLPKDSK